MPAPSSFTYTGQTKTVVTPAAGSRRYYHWLDTNNKAHWMKYRPKPSDIEQARLKAPNDHRPIIVIQHRSKQIEDDIVLIKAPKITRHVIGVGATIKGNIQRVFDSAGETWWAKHLSNGAYETTAIRASNGAYETTAIRASNGAYETTAIRASNE